MKNSTLIAHTRISHIHTSIQTPEKDTSMRIKKMNLSKLPV